MLRKWLRTVLFPSLLILGSPVAHSATSLLLVGDAWCPYNCPPGEPRDGYMVDLARAILTAAGYEVHYQMVPWTRAIELVRKGEADGLLAAVPAQLPDLVYPAHELGINRNQYFVRRGNPWRYLDLTSLSAIRLGVIQDYSYGERLDAYIRSHRHEALQIAEFRGSDAVSKALRALASGRIGSYIEDPAVVDYIRHQMMPSLALEVAGEESVLPLSIGFSSKRDDAPAIARLLDEGVARLRDQGELSAFLAPYHLRDWAPIK